MLSLIKKNLFLIHKNKLIYFFTSLIILIFFIDATKLTQVINLDINNKIEIISFIRIEIIFTIIGLIVPIFTIILIYKLYFDNLGNNQNRVELLLGYSPMNIILSQVNTLYICVVIMFLVPYILTYIILFAISFFNNKLLFLSSTSMIYRVIWPCISYLLYHFFIINSVLNVLILFKKNVFKAILSLVISLALFFYIYSSIYWNFIHLARNIIDLSEIIIYFLTLSFINIVIYFRIIINFKHIEFNK